MTILIPGDEMCGAADTMEGQLMEPKETRGDQRPWCFPPGILPFQPWLVGRAKVNTPDLVEASLGGKRRMENVPSPAPPLMSSVHGGAQDAFPSSSLSDAPRNHMRRR